MNKRNPLLFVILFFTCLSFAAEKQAPAVPEHIPARIILGWTGDPARTQAVTWSTEKPVTSPQAQVAVASPNADFQTLAKSVTATSIPVELAGGKQVNHYRAVFEGLKSGTLYTYRVGDGSTWSEWITFRTASEQPDAFRFLYIGDAQNNIKSLWSRSIRAAYAAAPDARFVVQAGDILAEGYDDNLWGEWCHGMGFIASTIPSLPVPGNHDVHRAPGSPNAGQVMSVSPLWNAHFSVPSNGPGAPLDHQSYYLDYQGVRFIFVDANVFANEEFESAEKVRVEKMQLKWLEETLKANPNKWTIVVQHQPVFAVSKDREYAEMRKVLEPLYDKYRVDLVLEGHDHAYARTHKVAEGKVVKDSAPGTVFAISVSGPKMYEVNRRFESLMAKTQLNTQMYQIISVDKDALDYRAFAIDGTMIDEFRLDKRAQQSLLIEQGSTTAAASGR